MPPKKSRIRNVKAPYTPRASQLEIHNDPSQYRVVVAHRRFGKTTAAINELIKDALEKPGRYWYIAPTYRQAKMIAFDELEKYMPPGFIIGRNKADLTFRLSTGSEIALKGIENRDKLRGAGLKGVVLDEVQEMNADDWEAVVQPMLLDTNGWAMFLGTPKGRGFFYNLAQRERRMKGWKSFFYDAYSTEIYDKEKIDYLKSSLPENVFREEYLAEFLDGEGVVFRNIRANVVPAQDIYSDPYPEGVYQVGVDLARLHDWTVITVINRMMQVVYWERFQQKDWDLQKIKILFIAQKYNDARIVIDATTYGDPIAQDLERSGANVLPVRFSRQNKKQFIENLQIKLEQNQITLPEEKILLEELESYSYERTKSGVVVYNAPKGFHDDCVISLALAIYELLPSQNSWASRHRKTLFLPDYEDDF